MYLISVDGKSFEPVECQILKRLRSAARDDFALVKVAPPIPKHFYFFQGEGEVSELLLASKYEYGGLFPIRLFPHPVAISLLRVTVQELIDGFITDDKFRYVDIGALYSSYDDAKKDIH